MAGTLPGISQATSSEDTADNVSNPAVHNTAAQIHTNFGYKLQQ